MAEIVRNDQLPAASVMQQSGARAPQRSIDIPTTRPVLLVEDGVTKIVLR